VIFVPFERHFPAPASACKTSPRGMIPLRTWSPPPSKVIQPSLKPSSIRMRGSGFFMPCDLKSGFPRLPGDGGGVNQPAEDFGKGLRNFRLGRHARRPLPARRSGDRSSFPRAITARDTSDIRGSQTIGTGLSSGCRKLDPVRRHHARLRRPNCSFPCTTPAATKATGMGKSPNALAP